MVRRPNYDKHPCGRVSDSASACWVGWRAIVGRLRASQTANRWVLCVECYPGAFEEEIGKNLQEGLQPSQVIYAPELLKPPRALDEMLRPVLGDDPVFGHMNEIGLEAFFDEEKLNRARETVTHWRDGLLLVVGVGAALVSPEPDVLVHADMARWEIQRRQRHNETGNLGADNLEDSPSLKYKRAFFVDWRAADRLKEKLLPRIDFFLDTNSATPKLATGDCVRKALAATAKRPFRVVPYFDPGPWGEIGRASCRERV